MFSFRTCCHGRLEARGRFENRLAAADRAVLGMRRVASMTTEGAADAGSCWLRHWLRHWLRSRLVETAWAATVTLGRDQVLLDHLEQLRDAQLVHAGPEVVSLGPQV